MDGGEEEREYDCFARGEGVALLRRERGDLCRVELDAIASAVYQSRKEPGILRDTLEEEAEGRAGNCPNKEGGGGPAWDMARA